MEENYNNKNSLNNYINELHREYEIWYSKVVRLNYRVWYGLQFIALMSGFLTSIFVALQDKEEWTEPIKIVCIVLPALGSVAGTIILQFKIFETWKLREEGRIAFQNLVNFGKSEIYKCKTEEDFEKLYELLVQKTNEIENDQANRFFSLYGSSFIASFTNKK
jgi:hypothetical protein